MSGVLNKNFGSHSTILAPKTVVDPTNAWQQLIDQNNDLKVDNQNKAAQLQQAVQQIQDQQSEMKELAQFRQILQNPIEKFHVEMFDENLFKKIRGHMIEMFGQGGEIDAEGRWVQTVVNKRLQLMLRQLLFMGLQRWPQVKAQLDIIIKEQGLMKR